MRTGAQLLVDCLLAQGVDTAFGVPGESYLAVLDALYDTSERIRMVPNRHEGGAAFMAEAWSKLTGRVGIVFVTRGPGATNAAIGVHTAMQNATPMILFVGQVGTEAAGRDAFQEIDYRAAFGPIAKWATEIGHADRVPETIARAFSVAQSGRPGPVVVALPEDVLTAPTGAAPGPSVCVPRPGPGAGAREAVARLLGQARAPLVIAAGRWSEAGRAALRRFAETNHLPVLADFRCQDLLDNDSPSYVGDAGLGKTPGVRALIREADLLLALGSELGEITTDGYGLLASPQPAQRLIHVHPGPEVPNKVFSAELALACHPEDLLLALDGIALDGRTGWAARTAAARADWIASLAVPPQPGALDMGAVMAHLGEVLPEGAILTNGAGNFTIWLNKHFRFRGGTRLLAPQSGAMGYGLPAAIAAKLAAPEACVVCFAGDGDFQMTASELGCALQTGARPIVLVLDNGSYGTIRMHQERSYPGRVSFTDIVNPDFAALARAYGFHGERVERSADFPAAFARARASASGALLALAIDVESLTPRQTLSAMREAAEKG
ncbi:thiamine pyrophosphate-dependent enzyme [Amaricoccus sp.]|uniref:thiamine pyrophosphate-dependent enzyme n=1 Tax=Amaricoccus sp. TaxID=1872485 RepID=UPI002BFF3C3F|nr:thiamine pyrophosphate-dependent enzyme [Amaricoccus sp.]HRW16286.1 thiamine pyrophosphate-binding protein [Amaricoccus sp.]